MSNSDHIRRAQPSTAPTRPLRRAAEAGSGTEPKFADLLRQRRPVPRGAAAPASPSRDPSGPPEQDAVSGTRHSRSRPDDPRDRESRQAHSGSELAQSAAARPPQVSQQERQRLEQLANNLATFCNDQAVIDSEGWHVRIPLRPDVLPDTTLDMNVSVHWIHMRFATTDADARRLVSLYSDELEQMLQQALTRPRDISIICD